MPYNVSKSQGLQAQFQTFPAPRSGWIKNQTLIGEAADGAEALDNWFVTATGARMRKGSVLHATLDAAATSMFSYKSGGSEVMFATTASKIFDVTSPADAEVTPTASVTGLSSGIWSTAQFANSGGDYLVCANGTDSVREFDGTTWTTPSITGVTSGNLSQVFVFKERLFFIEKDTLSFWYLASNAISGAATEFPLKGVFHLGGSLLFGTSWSLDSGSGLDDVAIFVTTEGEIAVYSGLDPSDANSWSLVGVYRIGQPLNKNGFYATGGDVAILTEDGIVLISEAIKQGRDTLQSSALTFPIEDAWLDVIANRSAANPFSATLWHNQTMLIIGTPTIAGRPTAFVANSRTNRWSRFIGWDVQCATVLNRLFYFGSESGLVFQGDTGSSDNGTEIEALWVPRFFEGGPENKFAVQARFRGRSTEGETYSLGLAAFSDYSIGSVTMIGQEPTLSSGGIWDQGVWDVMVWGGGEFKTRFTQWGGVRAEGASLAPAVKIGSNTNEPSVEAIGLDLAFHVGNVI